MVAPEIRLVCGPSRGLRVAHTLLSTTAAVGLLAAGQRAAWTAAALAGLLGAHLLASGRMRRESARAPRARLSWDHEPRLLTATGPQPASWSRGGLDSPWLLILPLRSLSTGRMHRCLVTRARNSADDFRRARVLLRHQAGSRAAPSEPRP